MPWNFTGDLMTRHLLLMAMIDRTSGYQAVTSIDVLLISQRLRRIDSNGSLRWVPARKYRYGNKQQQRKPVSERIARTDPIEE